MRLQRPRWHSLIAKYSLGDLPGSAVMGCDGIVRLLRLDPGLLVGLWKVSLGPRGQRPLRTQPASRVPAVPFHQHRPRRPWRLAAAPLLRVADHLFRLAPSSRRSFNVTGLSLPSFHRSTFRSYSFHVPSLPGSVLTSHPAVSHMRF